MAWILRITIPVVLLCLLIASGCSSSEEDGVMLCSDILEEETPGHFQYTANGQDVFGECYLEVTRAIQSSWTTGDPLDNNQILNVYQIDIWGLVPGIDRIFIRGEIRFYHTLEPGTRELYDLNSTLEARPNTDWPYGSYFLLTDNDFPANCFTSFNTQNGNAAMLTIQSISDSVVKGFLDWDYNCPEQSNLVGRIEFEAVKE